ncbi:MAG TPA: septum formation family protein [Candidatus Limnocylindrales bacterium]|nr:septum formation family protein [Candidatus Limnocylindrales bacterium]
MHDDRRERDKYPHASLAEQIGGELAALRRSPPVIALLLAIVGGWLILTVTRPQPLRVGEIRTGDCLYIHALDADTNSQTGRPIGSDGAVISALFRGGAERAGCDASHSHEVADAWVLEDSLTAAYPGQAELTVRERDRCEAAFEAYVGRPSDGSALEYTVAIPPPFAWADGARAAACLVANRDGSFLSGHAAGSGR